MPLLNITIKVLRDPLKRTYVEHVWEFAGIRGPLGVYITDDNGKVSINSATDDADIRILCQNSVAKVVEGSVLLVGSIQVNRRVRDGATIDITKQRDKVDQFRILNQTLNHYESVWKQFKPFSGLPNPGFPLGRARNLQATLTQPQRIEIVYPDNLPQDLAFTEPMSLGTGYPLIHIKGPGEDFDKRLFGDGDTAPTLIPSEFAHALHFSQLDQPTRFRIETDYVKWLLKQLAEGESPTHDMGVKTTPMVAFIEALDHFSSRYAQFVALKKIQTDQPRDADKQKAFLVFELAEKAEDYWLNKGKRDEDKQVQAGKLDPNDNNKITPSLTGANLEGAVYGAIFLDFAGRTSLATAVEAYFDSKALSFGQYRSWVHVHMPRHSTAIDAVKLTWKM